MPKKKSTYRKRRRASVESMEPRIPLAADVGHNFLMPADVNNDHCVRAGDALAIINMLARHQGAGQDDSHTEAVDASVTSMFYDVNDDGRASAADALRVINEVALDPPTSELTQWLEGQGSVRARIELETSESGRAELSVRLVGAPAGQSFDLIVGDEKLGKINTNDQGRGKLELEYGGSHPPVPEVLVTADGTTPVAIGDLLAGTLGSLGDVESSDGGTDQDEQHSTDHDDDAISDSSSDDDGPSMDDHSREDHDDSTDGGSDASTDGPSDDLQDDQDRGGAT